MARFLTGEDYKAMPKEALNWRLVFAAGSACMAGSLFGFDTGNIGGIIVLDSFKETFGLTANGPNAYQAPSLSANIVTALQAGAILGALVAYTAADRFGRRWTLIMGATIFLIGCVLQLIANLKTLYAGRVVSGIATGLTSVVAPMYISETSPKAIRGALTTCFNLIIVTSLSLAFWINYGVSLWSHPSDKQWRVPMATQMIPGGLLLIGMIFQKESPRYLVGRDRVEEAVQVVTYTRQLPADHPFVAGEIAEITESVRAENAAVAGSSITSLFKELFTLPANRRRYILAMILQIFQQMTGTNAINYFAPSIFSSVGLSGTSNSLLATGVYGIVKVCTTIIYVLLIVDNVGRRKPLMTGALIQACCLLYLTVYVKLATTQTGQVTAGGYVGIISIYIYAFGWSFGWSVVPWVVPSEIFPTRVRAIAMSTIFAFQWLLNFAITRSTPYMMLNLDKWGAYLIFSVFTFGSAAWAFFFFPELKGRSIESMDNLFNQSAFTMLRRAYPSEEDKTLRIAPEGKSLEAGLATASHIEESSSRTN